jgi:predicted unusual protein kinase regulating ubiquinone biosynthesis (AarF/ABC1/UbiB family)
MGRWATLARLSGRASARVAAHRARRLAAPVERRQELDAQFQLRTAEDVAATLGGMKGAFMKVGQLLSFVDDGMPEHVRAALAQLQDSAPPMTSELAARMIRDELGASPDAIFRAWDPVPMAAASIGQVHRAVLDDGTEVAVKVQYPGIGKTMEADLAQLDLARLIMPTVWKSLDADAVTAELRTRLTEELDYRLEASNQADFAAWYSEHPFIRVPRVIDELSTARVLTSTLATGSRFAQLDGWSQHERDLAGEAIFRFVFRSLHDHLAFNGDPHPGNYLFHGGGVVTFLDFGLVKRFTLRDRDREVAMVHALAIQPDPKRLRSLLEEAGYFAPGAPLTDEQVFDFSSLFWSYAFEDKPVTLTPEWASHTVRRYLFKDEEFREIDRWGAVPPEFVIMQRIVVGLFAILGRLNATANWRRIITELWWGGAPASELGELEARWLAGRTAPV